MDELIETIRASLASDATDEARATGATACRAILSALETKPGEAMAPATATAASTDAITTIVTALRGMPPEQLLDLAITRLRSALPPDVTPPTPQRLKFQLVPIPRRG